MKEFGDRLKRAREAKGVSLHHVASSTRISERYLQALEQEDLDVLPAAVFAKGYIRSYAEFLDIDPKPLLDAYRDREREYGRGTAEDDRRKLDELARLVDAHSGPSLVEWLELRHVLAAAAGIAGVVLVVGTAWYVLRSPADVAEPAPVVARRTTRARSPSVASVASTKPRDIAEPETLASHLRVTRAGVGTDIVERNLVGKNDRFSEGEKVWFWTRVVGGVSGETVRHVWVHENQTYMDAELSVGDTHWRTYSTLVLEPGTAGAWSVEARAADGRVLAREEFRCVSPRDGT